jgi:hypothetical protein
VELMIYTYVWDMTVLILAGLSAFLPDDFCGCLLSYQTTAIMIPWVSHSHTLPDAF